MASSSTTSTPAASVPAPAPAPAHPIIPHPISTLPHTPTHAYLITHMQKATQKGTQIHDLSPSISTLYSPVTGLSLPIATSLVASTPTSTPPLYTLYKDNILGTQFSLHDVSGSEIAEWKNPVASVHLGHRVHLRFMDLEHRGTGVEAHLQGWSESFTTGETKYIWEMDEWKHEQQVLFKITGPPTSKAIHGERHPVAIFAAEAAHVPSGLLVLDKNEIEPLICLLTLCALLDAPKSQGRIDRVAEFVLSAVMGL